MGARWWTIVGGIAIAFTTTGCIGASDCDTGAPRDPDVQFIGTATDVADDEVTFAVEEVGHGAPGDVITLSYLDRTGRFLHEGRRYDVRAYADEGVLTASVKTAQSCGGSTVNADGSPIDTGVFRDFSWGLVVRWVVVPVAALVAVLLGVVWLLGRRTRKLEHEPS